MQSFLVPVVDYFLMQTCEQIECDVIFVILEEWSGCCGDSEEGIINLSQEKSTLFLKGRTFGTGLKGWIGVYRRRRGARKSISGRGNSTFINSYAKVWCIQEIEILGHSKDIGCVADEARDVTRENPTWKGPENQVEDLGLKGQGRQRICNKGFSGLFSFFSFYDANESVLVWLMCGPLVPWSWKVCGNFQWFRAAFQT